MTCKAADCNCSVECRHALGIQALGSENRFRRLAECRDDEIPLYLPREVRYA